MKNYSVLLSINNDIKYYTEGLLLKKNKKDNKNIFMLLTSESIMIMPCSMSTIIEKYSYDDINEITLNPIHSNKLTILFEQGANASFFFHNRDALLKAIECYYSLYHMIKYNKIKELKINNKVNKQIIQQITINGYTLYHNKNGYSYFLPNHYRDEKGFHIINNEVKILVRVSKVEEMNQRNIGYSFQEGIHSYLQKHYKRYITMKSGQSYNKKMNLNNDKAIWDCIRLKYNTSTNERIIIIILRRKFIPPLYTSFQDIMIVQIEPLSTKKNNCIIETIADSIHYNEKVNYDFQCKQYNRILLANVESLILNEETSRFYYNNLNIKGKYCFLFALKYLYKVINIIDNKSSLKEELWDMLIEKEPNYKNDKTIDEIINDFILSINTNNSKEYLLKYKDIWTEKIWRYLGFVVNRGIIDSFGYQELLSNNKLSINEQICCLLYYNNTIINWNLFNYLLKENKILLYIKNINILITLLSNRLNESNIDIELLINLKTFIYRYPSDKRLIFLPILNQLIKIIKDYNKYSEETILAVLTLIKEYSFDEGVNVMIQDKSFIERIITFVNHPNEKNIFITLRIINSMFNTINSQSLHSNIDIIIPNINVLLFKVISIITSFSFETEQKINDYYYDIITIKSCFIILVNLLKLNHSLIYEKLRTVLVEREKKLSDSFTRYILYYLNEKKSKLKPEYSQYDIQSLQIMIFKFLNMFIRNNYIASLSLLDINYGKLINEICDKHIIFVQSIQNGTLSSFDEDNDIKIRKLEYLIRLSLTIMKQNKDIINELKQYKNFPFNIILNILEENRKKNIESKNDSSSGYKINNDTSSSFNKMDDISRTELSIKDISAIKEEESSKIRSSKSISLYSDEPKVKKIKFKRKFKKKNEK